MTTTKQSGCGGKLGASAFLSVFLLMGLFFCGLLVHETWKQAKTHFWDQVECEIQDSSATTGGEDSGPYAFQARYTYTYNGQHHESTQVALDGGGTRDYRDVQRLLIRCQPGTKATCWVNPENPEEAVLQHGSITMIFFIFIPLVFVLIGGGGIIGIWMDKDTDESTKPLSAQSNGRTAGIVVLGLFALVGAAFLFGAFGPAMFGLLQSTTWTPLTCVIDSSRVRESSDSDGTTYRVDILFRYELDGVEYRSNNYNFTAFSSSSGRSGKRQITKQYPIGSEHTCYVNPNDPSQAVLHRGFSTTYLFALIPLAFLAIGVFGIIAMLRQPTARQSFAERASLSANRQPMVLKSKNSPIGRLILVIFFAAFWNGIVSVFLIQVVHGFHKGNPEWFLVFFLIPFVLVGLGLIIGVLYSLLALFNPRPQVRLTPGALRLGETGDLQWRLRGKSSRISHFTVELEGREEATYRVGTNSRTDKHVFHSTSVFETNDPRQMSKGRLEVSIPADLMHSFSASNNKIIWSIRIHGDIKRWPDISEEFHIEVLP